MAIFPQQLSGYVAEIGAAFLCAELGITQDVRADHAQYLASWLQLLKDDDRAIFTAAARASEAVNYLNGLQHAKPGPAPGVLARQAPPPIQAPAIVQPEALP